MLYSADNKQQFYKDLWSISGNVHDSDCPCFRYDRDKHEVYIHMDNIYYKTKYDMSCYNVKLFFSTNFDMWGICPEEIEGIEPVDSESITKSLNFLITNKAAGGLSQDIIDSLLGIRILFRTGNEVFILCESISIEPDSVIILGGKKTGDA